MTPAVRILCVEDDDAVRDALVEFLEHEGYLVHAAPGPAEALAALRAEEFSVVITDYHLGDVNGVQMVQAARGEGLLRDTPIIVVTANLSLETTPDMKVLRKPLDVDELLRHVHLAVAPARVVLERAREELWTRGREAVPRIEFVLYVSSSSPSSQKAIRNMEKLLQEYEASQVSFTVCDLSRLPFDALAEDKIAFTPTLVKKQPEPKTWVLGDLEDNAVVQDLLQFSGVERKRKQA